MVMVLNWLNKSKFSMNQSSYKFYIFNLKKNKSGVILLSQKKTILKRNLMRIEVVSSYNYVRTLFGEFYFSSVHSD